MNTKLLRLPGLLLLLLPLQLQAAINIFACEPEWAALAKEIAGEQASIYSATHALQDPHHIRARPGLIAKIRRADLLICSGAGLEQGWLPILLQRANKNIQPGRSGHLMASDYVELLDKPEQLDRSLGHLHAEGNPHVHLDPRRLLTIAGVLAEKLGKIDSGNAAIYAARHKHFRQRWQQAITDWQQLAAPLKQQAIIAHHKSWLYLADWLQLRLVETLEARPGVPPTASHLEKLLQQTNSEKIFAIIRTPYDPAEASEWLHAKSKVPALVLPYTVGGNDDSPDLFSLFDSTIKQLLSLNHDR